MGSEMCIRDSYMPLTAPHTPILPSEEFRGKSGLSPYGDFVMMVDDVVAQAHKDGYAVTLFGRRRYIPELKAKNAAQRGFGERTAMNHPMQGTAADIIKLAMRQVQDELVARDLGTRLMLQVHDELDLSVPESEVEEVSDLLTSVMESVVELSVPLLVDVSAGANWAEAH